MTAEEPVTVSDTTGVPWPIRQPQLFVIMCGFLSIVVCILIIVLSFLGMILTEKFIIIGSALLLPIIAVSRIPVLNFHMMSDDFFPDGLVFCLDAFMIGAIVGYLFWYTKYSKKWSRWIFAAMCVGIYIVSGSIFFLLA